MTDSQFTIRIALLTIAIAFFIVSFTFISVGCSALYEVAGMSTEEAIATADDDKAKTKIVVKQVRDKFWEAVYAGTAIAGAAVSGWLGVRTRRLGKINKAVIRGVEKGTSKDVKSCIAEEAKKLNVGDALHKLVKVIT